MPRQNRVTPTGELVADSARGLFMGNRGCLHNEFGRVIRTYTGYKAWVTCALEFKGRKRQLMYPNHYTELFFLDETVAFSAGHRPCAECRRADYNRFAESWAAAFGSRLRVSEMDAKLARDRLDGSAKRPITHAALLGDLPDGVFVDVGHPQPRLWWMAKLYPYGYEQYGVGAAASPNEEVQVLTPRSTVEVLRAGYRPVVHSSAC